MLSISDISIPQAILIIEKVKNLSHDDALTYYAELANLKLINDVLNDIETMEKEYYLEQHPNKIYYSESDKRWRTYLPLENGKRKPITSTSQVNLEKKIIDFYKQREDTPNTIEKLYPRFLSYKGKETTLANAHKLNWVWETYYTNDRLIHKRFDELTVIDLKEWFLDKIQKYQLTNRKFKEMKSLLNMLYDFAIEMKVAHENVSRNVRGISNKKFTPAIKKDITEQVYIDDEESQLIEMALSGYQKTKNTAYLAICLNCTLACRVGEVVALMRNDFSANTVHIQRQEVKRYIEDEAGKLVRNGYEIVDYTKTPESNRELILTSNAKLFYALIVSANEQRGFQSEYLFLDKNGNRMHNDAINNVLRRLNKKINTVQKGNHSIRKTCLSNMYSSNQLSDVEVMQFSGHKLLSTLQNNYLFPVESKSKRTDAYETAINSKITVDVFKRVQNL